jgi:hypothetical protein
MRILLTDLTGYIAKRLLTVLLSSGNESVCCVRDKKGYDLNKYDSALFSVIEVDFFKSQTPKNSPLNIDAGYYIIHSMSTSTGDFEKMEEKAEKLSWMIVLRWLNAFTQPVAIRNVIEFLCVVLMNKPSL